MNSDFAGIDQIEGAVRLLRSQEMLAPSELDAADPAHAPPPARSLEPAERLRSFETMQGPLVFVPFGCGACAGGSV